jgi:hypothetical protein
MQIQCDVEISNTITFIGFLQFSNNIVSCLCRLVGCFLLLLDGRDLLAVVCVFRGVEDIVHYVVGVTFRWCGFAYCNSLYKEL